MACLFMSAVSKNLSERRSTKSDMSPVSLRSAMPSGKSQNRVSQVLQVPPVSLYGRKKSVAKDLAHSESPVSTLLGFFLDQIQPFVFREGVKSWSCVCACTCV